MPYRGAVAVTHRRKPKMCVEEGSDQGDRAADKSNTTATHAGARCFSTGLPANSRSTFSTASIASSINPMTRRIAFGTCEISALLGAYAVSKTLPELPRDRLANDKVGL